MNERAVELYKQAVTFAYNTAGQDAGNGTVIESLTAGKFAELIVQECADICLEMATKCAGLPGDGALAKDCADWILKDFGVEE